MMDIVNLPKGAKWGHFNDRRVDRKWVRDLVVKFKGNFEHRDDVKVIPVVVRRSWLDLAEGAMGLPKADGVPLEDIPLVKFTAVGLQEIEREGLWMMGGNHRQLALNIWVGEMKKELKILTDRAGKIQADGNDTGNTLATSAATEKILMKARALEEKITKSCLWLVILHDRCTCSMFESRDASHELIFEGAIARLRDRVDRFDRQHWGRVHLSHLSSPIEKRDCEEPRSV
jgi:hypothetical protein